MYKEISNKFLKDFLKYSEELDKLYNFPRSSYSKEWIEVKVSISNSIISLYKYSNMLFSKDFLCRENETTRFYAFYFDLILSKLRNSLFTETPKDSERDIMVTNAKEIASIAQDLLDYSKIDDTFNINFSRLIFKIFTMYDFIFYKDEGVFSRFFLSKEKYETIYNDSFKLEENNSFRTFGQNILQNILKSYIETDDQYNIDDVYKDYVYRSKKEIIELEPFSYFLAYKIWKMSKIIQATFEYKKEKDYLKEKEVFRKKLKKYLEDTNNKILEFYENKITNYELFLSFLEYDKEIIAKHLFNNLLPNYDLETKLSTEVVKDFQNYLKEIDRKSIKHIKKIIIKMISDNEYDRFKFFRVLEDKEVTIDDISFLIENLNDLITESDDDFEIIGMLRSGVLLSHCINISKNLGKPIYMFSSFPYVSFLPRIYSDKQRTLIVDESIKSGFSTDFLNMYRKRGLISNGKSIRNYSSKTLTLVNLLNFNNANSSQAFSVANIKAVNGKLKVLEDDIIETKSKKMFDWKKYYTEHLDEPDLFSESINLKEIEINVNDEIRIDITRLLSDSKKFFNIGKFFYEKLKEKFFYESDNSKKLILYACTDEGKVLCDLIAFSAKVLEEKIEILLNKKKADEKIIHNKNEYIVIFVDLSIDSMNTLERAMNILKIKTENINNYIDGFCTILSSKEAEEKFKDKIIKIATLRD